MSDKETNRGRRISDNPTLSEQAAELGLNVRGMTRDEKKKAIESEKTRRDAEIEMATFITKVLESSRNQEPPPPLNELPTITIQKPQSDPAPPKESEKAESSVGVSEEDPGGLGEVPTVWRTFTTCEGETIEVLCKAT